MTNLQATPGDGQVALSWTNPTSFDTIKVVRKAGHVGPADPTDGTTVFNGTGSVASTRGLTNGTIYQYAVWVVRGGALVARARARDARRAGARPGHRPSRHRGRRPDRALLDEPDDGVRPGQGRAATPTAPPADPTDGTDDLQRHRHVGHRHGPDQRRRSTTTPSGRRAPASPRARPRASSVPESPPSADTYTTQPTATTRRPTSVYNIGVVFHVTADKALPGSAASTRPGSTARQPDRRLRRRRRARCSHRRSDARLADGDARRTARPARRASATSLGVKEAAGSPWSGARVADRPAVIPRPRRHRLQQRPPRSAIPTSATTRRRRSSVAEDWTMTFGAVSGRPLAPGPGHEPPGRVSATRGSTSPGRTRRRRSTRSRSSARSAARRPTRPTARSSSRAPARPRPTYGADERHRSTTPSGRSQRRPLSSPALISATPHAGPPAPVTAARSRPRGHAR